jgi:hypothetical protein
MYLNADLKAGSMWFYNIEGLLFLTILTTQTKPIIPYGALKAILHLIELSNLATQLLVYDMAKVKFSSKGACLVTTIYHVKGAAKTLLKNID